MTADKGELPKINLSRLKFANWQEPPDEKDSDDSSLDDEVKPSRPVEAPGLGPTAIPLNMRRPEAYERMAADRPGEEMAHDATIWKLYLEEAEEHDQELVKSRQASLDMLLLFAALFSAILTAFLIESKDQLEQDPADTTNALLLFIAQSQQRMELGLPPLASDVPSDNLFTAPMSARVINGIWFTSLALALSAALIAMLCKEWLTAYVSSRPRHAYTHALLRHLRLEGLDKWWALHIIALLPSLLHLSLLLFSIGLVIYLWVLDKTIASVIAGVIGVTVVFYAMTAVLGAVYQYCPYVTQISAYLQAVYTFYRGSRSSEHEMRSFFTSELDLRALLWLANNARDPAVIDCSYQALAGLRLPPGFAGSTPDRDVGKGAVESEDESPGAMIQLDKQTTLGSLFLVVADRFERLMRMADDRSTSGWENAARYARVLAELSGYIRKCDRRGQLLANGEDETGISWVRNEKDIRAASFSALLGDQGPSQFMCALTRILDTFSHLWQDEVPSLHSDVYTSFVATELFLLTYAASDKLDEPVSLFEPTGLESDKLVDSHSIKMSSILTTHPATSQDVFKLRAHYSRSLTRASTLIWFHSQRRAIISSAALDRLLNALFAAAKCEVLNPLSSLSTHHPQSTIDSSNNFRFVMPYNTSSWYFYDAFEISNGLLGDLSSLLRMSPRGQEDATLQTRILAIRAFSALAPVLLQQTLGISRETLTSRFDYTSWPDASKLDMNAVRYVATRQAYEVIRAISPHLDKPEGHINMCYTSLNVVGDYITEHQEHGYSALLAMAHTGDALVPLIRFAGANDQNFSIVAPKTVSLLIDQVRLPFDAGWAICNTFLPPDCFPPLLRMIKHANNNSQSIKELLQFMLQRMKGVSSPPLSVVEVTRLDLPAIEFIEPFTHTSNGFAALSFASVEEKHVENIVSGTADIVHVVSGNDEAFSVDPVELNSKAVPGFLDAVSLVVGFLAGNSERYILLFDFIDDATKLLAVIAGDSSSRKIVASHRSYQELRAALEKTADEPKAQVLLLKIERLWDQFKSGIEEDIDKVEAPVPAHASTDLANDLHQAFVISK